MKLFYQNEREFRLLLNSIDCVLNIEEAFTYSVIDLIKNQIENFDQSELGRIMALIDEASTNNTNCYKTNEDCWVKLYSLLQQEYCEIVRKESIFDVEEDYFLMLRLNLVYALYVDNFEMDEILIEIMKNINYFSEDQVLDIIDILYSAKSDSDVYQDYAILWDNIITAFEKKSDEFGQDYTYRKNN